MKRSKVSLFLVTILICGCGKDSVDSINWKIGENLPKHKIIVDSQELKKVKVCSEEYKNVGFPVHLNITYDQKTYFGLLEGLCISVHAKKIKVEFASPSSGKMARGTYEVLE